MDRKTFDSYILKSLDGLMPDCVNPAFTLNRLPADFLVAVVAGELDLNELAKRELESRGLDAKGAWVGFEKTID